MCVCVCGCVCVCIYVYIDEFRVVTSIDGRNVFTVDRAVNRRPVWTPILRVHSLLDPSAVSVWFIRDNTFPVVCFYRYLHINVVKCCNRNIPSYNWTIKAMYSIRINVFSAQKIRNITSNQKWKQCISQFVLLKVTICLAVGVGGLNTFRHNDYLNWYFRAFLQVLKINIADPKSFHFPEGILSYIIVS